MFNNIYAFLALGSGFGGAQCAQTLQKSDFVIISNILFFRAFLYHSVDFFTMKAEKIEAIRSADSFL